MITLQDVKKETGISYHTIVKYTGLGLLPKPQRVWRGRKGSESWYPDNILICINKIKKLQKSGRTLRQIAESHGADRPVFIYTDIFETYPDYHFKKGNVKKKNNPDGSISITVEMKGERWR